ncbi:endonuclease domain-containing protein [Sphaerisporangium perillae]|uniref:endonuclease domain-containing protein n=1 Tax=Sphaerisporangium perillae TaxID=2935860 RepID=UPI00200EA084|nr:DUF559 domain-containing protein [Sphaerisporangium perillae]
MAESWDQLSKGRVVRLSGANTDITALLAEPLADDAPAILGYSAAPARSVPEMVAAALHALETAAVELFPAWLPGAEGIDAPSFAAVTAVRALALRAASTGPHFGPFLADLAESSLRGVASRSSRFTPEVRAAGLARLLAAAFHRPQAAILLNVPGGLAEGQEEVLVAGCEWLAGRGGLAIWLTGAPLVWVDRVETVRFRLPTDAARPAQGVPRAEGRLQAAIAYPAVAGMPHPASSAEKALEAALSSRAWAAGRAWNQTYRPHPLANPIRVDLLWSRERCVVEIDGLEHHAPARHLADRHRDGQLRSNGYAVLRITNAQVLTDTDAVVGQVERFLRGRRGGTLEG